jgi:hypothetical protein
VSDPKSEVDLFRERLRRMPDEELLRFSDAAQQMCSIKGAAEIYAMQLREARSEWQRRHPPKVGE